LEAIHLKALNIVERYKGHLRPISVRTTKSQWSRALVTYWGPALNPGCGKVKFFQFRRFTTSY